MDDSTNPLLRVFVAMVLVGLGLAVLVEAGVFGPPRSSADSVADWVVTNAYFDGKDPYRPINDLAAEYEIDYVSAITPVETPHPRLPGAFLVMSPMILTDAKTASVGLRLIGVLALAAIVGFFAGRIQYRPLMLGVLALSATVTGAAIWAFGWITQSPVLAAVIGAAALLIHRRSRSMAVGGGLIGLAAVLKPFLLILLIPLRKESRRPALAGLAVFFVLNGLGLLASNVELRGAIRALSTAGELWLARYGNLSLSSWISRGTTLSGAVIVAVSLALLAGFVLFLRRRSASMHLEIAAFGLLGMLISPISWPHYLLIILPFVWLAIVDDDVPALGQLVIGAGLAMWIWLLPVAFNTLGLVAMFVGVAISIRPERRSSPSGSPADGVPT